MTLHQEKGDRLFLTCGMEGCLYLYLPSQWNKLLANDLQSFTLADKEQERAFKRKFFSEATDVELDGAGRILIPDFLKDFAGLATKVVVAGLNDRAEIWDEKRWDAYRSDLEAKGDQMAQKLGETGLI